MQRRDFSLAAVSLALLPLAAPSHAQCRPFKAGTDYIVLGKPAPVDAPAGKVEVIEFFSFNCPHCAAFEPKVEPWIKQLPAHVAFRRVPVPFVGNDTDAKARFYYALEAMGKADEFVPKVFQAIHKDRQNLTGDAAILAWVEKQQAPDRIVLTSADASVTLPVCPYPNKPTYSVQLWGPGGIQNGVHVAELEDTCFVLTNVNGAC